MPVLAVVMPVMGVAMMAVPVRSVILVMMVMAVLARTLMTLAVIIMLVMITGVIMMVMTTAAGAVVVMRVFMMRMTMMLMTMMIMMRVPMMMTMVVMAAIVARDRPLGAEGPLDRYQAAALPADQFRHRIVLRDVDRVVRHLHGGVVLAEMPEHAHEAQRVLGLHLDELFVCGLHRHELAVFELEGVAVIELRSLRQVQMDIETGLRREVSRRVVSRDMVECDRIDDTVGLDGRFANDARGLGHCLYLFEIMYQRLRPSTGVGLKAAMSTPSRQRTLMARIGVPSGIAPSAKGSTPQFPQNRWRMRMVLN